MKSAIAKAEWLAAQQCARMAWHAIRSDSPPPGEAERFRMQQGQEVGELARALYPGGTLIPRGVGGTSAELTRAALADGAKTSFFEATVLAAPFIATADILTRVNGGLHVLEVKSSFSDTKKLDELVDDLAYTVMVFRRGGLPVAKASLVLLSRGYQFGDAAGRLFEVVDKTTEVFARVLHFDSLSESSSQAILADTPPEPKLVSACRACEWFSDECLGHGVAHTVLELPSLHYTKLRRLSDAGIIDLSDIPIDLGLNQKQDRVRRAAISEELVVDPGLAQALRAIQWPCHYLDFETVASVLPLYPGHHCHEQVVTQFSIHHRDSVDAQHLHSEYLADAARDCQREVAEALVSALRQDGSIVVYSPFEQTRIQALADAFPAFAVPLRALLARLVDLLPLVADHVYHPEFDGSFSIKAVLPALIPNLSYEALAIGDGDTAITRFARMARGEMRDEEVESTRRQLLEYCALDTLAMVRLHDKLMELAW